MVFKLGAGSSWAPVYDLIWIWAYISTGAWHMAGLISAPYLFFCWGRKCHVYSGRGSGELMAEYLQREALCYRDVENQTATQNWEKYKDWQKNCKAQVHPWTDPDHKQFHTEWNLRQTQVPHRRFCSVCSTTVTWAALHREVQRKAGIEELALSMGMRHPSVSVYKPWEPEGALPAHTTWVTATWSHPSIRRDFDP